MMANINIKLVADLEFGITFISVIKKTNEKSLSGLLTFDGKLC